MTNDSTTSGRSHRSLVSPRRRQTRSAEEQVSDDDAPSMRTNSADDPPAVVVDEVDNEDDVDDVDDEQDVVDADVTADEDGDADADVDAGEDIDDEDGTSSDEKKETIAASTTTNNRKHQPKGDYSCYSLAPFPPSATTTSATTSHNTNALNKNARPHHPLVIGHRGAPYSIPEHTIPSYRLAFELGASYVEPDFVPTSDGYLIAVHSVDLSITTDVQEKFPGRERTIVYRGLPWTAYYSFDFTLDEILTLRVKQRLDNGVRSHDYDWQFGIPTLRDIVTLIHEWNESIRTRIGRAHYGSSSSSNGGKVGGGGSGTRVGMYAELKEPSWIRKVTGMVMEDMFLDEIASLEPKLRNELIPPPCAPAKAAKAAEESPSTTTTTTLLPPLVVHCFERATLKYLRTAIELDADDVFRGYVPPLSLLLSARKCRTFRKWDDVSQYVDLVGPDASCLSGPTLLRAPSSSASSSGRGRTKKGRDHGMQFVNAAHSRNIGIHAWTERAESDFVLAPFDDAASELKALFCRMGVDGIFAENVDVAVRVAAEGCPGKEGGGSSSTGGHGLVRASNVARREIDLFRGRWRHRAASAAWLLAAFAVGYFAGLAGAKRRRRDRRRRSSGGTSLGSVQQVEESEPLVPQTVMVSQGNVVTTQYQNQYMGVNAGNNG